MKNLFVISESIFVLFNQELDNVVEELEKIAKVNLLQHRSIISLIGNVQRSSLILEKVRIPIPPFWVGQKFTNLSY